jgi:nicotinamidase-related amidase
MSAPTSSRFPRSRTALLIVDVINPLDFPGGARFAPAAARAIERIAALRARAHAARVPVIFVNDNLGRWRSDIEGLIEGIASRPAPGRPLLDILRPEKHDYVVLKSTLSGFHQTPLEAMLRLGEVRTVIITGLVTGNCILFTAVDAYMRNYQLIVPSDCVADQKPAEHKAALVKMRTLLKARVEPSERIRLRR